MCFQFETAERPASNASRKPSRVSPRGVLIDIPVTTMRSVLNKKNLQHSKGANRVIPCDLTGTDCLEVVPLDCRCGYIEPLPWADFVKKCRMMNAGEANIQ